MLQQSVAKLEQGLGDAVAEISQHTLTGLVGLGTPAFDDTAGRLAVRRHKAACMGRKPERREIRIELFREHKVEVGLDVGRTRQARGVAEYTQLRAVRDDSPQAVILCIEEFLHQSMGRMAASFVAESRITPIEIEVVRGE